MNDEPQKLEFGQWYGGRSHPVWHYESLPDGVRLAGGKDLWQGRPVLWQVQLGPDAGQYYAALATRSNIPILLDYLQRGIPVYVKK